MEPKHSYRAFREEVPDESETMAIGKAEVAREGKDLTLVAWGAMRRPAQKAVDKLAEARNASIELIDLLSMAPLDAETLCASVRKTGRCVVVQEAPRNLSISSEIVARINDEALVYLEAPVARVTGFDVVTPNFGREQLYLPNERRIGDAIQATLDF